VGAAEALGGSTQDVLDRTLRIGQHIAIPQSYDRPARFFEIGGTPSVLGHMFGMLAPVELDREFRRTAGKIDDVRPDRQLTREARAVAGDALPDQALGIGWAIAEIAGIPGQARGNAVAHYGSVAGSLALATHPQPLPFREGSLQPAGTSSITSSRDSNRG
jgi:hypothetical protein